MNYRTYSPLITATDSQYLAEMKANKHNYIQQNMEYLGWHLSGFAQMQSWEYLLSQAKALSFTTAVQFLSRSFISTYLRSVIKQHALLYTQALKANFFYNLYFDDDIPSLPFFFFVCVWRLLGVSQQSRALNILAKQLILEYITPLFIYFLRMTLWIILASILKKNLI